MAERSTELLGCKCASTIQVSNKANFRISAKEEVVLFADASQSPQLLMVFGIGPRNILSAECGRRRRTFDYTPRTFSKLAYASPKAS